MPKKGIVAFFDILGYQNLVRNSDIKYVADVINQNINGLQPFLNSYFKDLFGDLDGSDDDHIGKIDTRVISDSILLTCECDEDDDWMWFFFLAYAAKMMRLAFEDGLPLRGAISYGEYYVEGYSFAGIPIMDAYSLSESLEFSGCALTVEGIAALKKTIEHEVFEETIFLPLVTPYFAPLKKEEKDLYILNWYCSYDSLGEFPEDLRQYVFESFYAHGKSVPMSVVPKIENTERTCRFWILVKKQIERARAVKEAEQAKAVAKVTGTEEAED